MEIINHNHVIGLLEGLNIYKMKSFEQSLRQGKVSALVVIFRCGFSAIFLHIQTLFSQRPI